MGKAPMKMEPGATNLSFLLAPTFHRATPHPTTGRQQVGLGLLFLYTHTHSLTHMCTHTHCLCNFLVKGSIMWPSTHSLAYLFVP